MQQIKEVIIRKAIKLDYESVIKIMSQVQDMHVKWRPDIYKPNENLIPEDVFEKVIAVKYDIPNDKLEMFDEYMKMVDDFYNHIIETNA